MTDKGCSVSPYMIVEVVSPFNPRNDYIKKLSLYEELKVREYWIVNPMEQLGSQMYNIILRIYYKNSICEYYSCNLLHS